MEARMTVWKNDAYYLVDPKHPEKLIGIDQISEYLNDTAGADNLLVIIESMVDRLAHHEIQAELKEQGFYEKFKHLPTDPEYGLQKCSICGCTDNNACIGGCTWSAPNLCSSCVYNAVEHLMCADCSLPMLAKTLSCCNGCSNVNCDHTCSFADDPDTAPVVQDENPPCENWECKQRQWCEWAFITGYLVGGNTHNNED